MGALVEAQLEATAKEHPALLRAHWRTSLDGAGAAALRCNVVVGGLLKAEGEAPATAPSLVVRGMATLVLSAADGATLEIARTGDAVVGTIEELETRLRACTPSMTLEASMFLRVCYDEALGLPAAALGGALGDAVSQGGRWQCAAFAVPVVRVLSPDGGARLALQLHFSARCPEPVDAD